jgi:hypothetical protein
MAFFKSLFLWFLAVRVTAEGQLKRELERLVEKIIEENVERQRKYKKCI